MKTLTHNSIENFQFKEMDKNKVSLMHWHQNSFTVIGIHNFVSLLLLISDKQFTNCLPVQFLRLKKQHMKYTLNTLVNISDNKTNLSDN